MSEILIVEDDPEFRARVRGHVEKVTRATDRIREAGTLQAAREAIEACLPEVLILDISFPLAEGRPPDGRAGIKLLRSLAEWGPVAHVIVLSGQDRRQAVELLLSGKVEAYLFKDWGPEEVEVHVQRALSQEGESRKQRALAKDAARHPRLVVGDSQAMQAVRSKAEKVAATDTTLLLQGESGTGKEVFARFVHAQSARRDGPFVAISAAALPRELAEAELFGARKGAYTGLDRDREGALALARGGTFFLDEVGELPLDLQPKLLRALQERTFRPLGASAEVSADFRLICATHRDLEAMVEEGSFREDLYYRVRVFPLELPPLRERLEDLPALLAHWIERLNRDMGRSLEGVHPEALRLLESHPWPGNVRELANVIEYAFVLAEGPQITEADLPQLRARANAGDPLSYGADHRQALEAFERAYLEAALAQHQGNVTETAEAIGTPRRTLQDRMRRLGMSSPRG